MEKNKKTIDGNGWSNLFNNIQLYVAMSMAALLAMPNNAVSQTNNDSKTTLNITKISISDYQSLIQQRDQIIEKNLSNFTHNYNNVTDFLEQTQKQIFLNHYKNNKNLVRQNINKISEILKNKYGLKIENDPIEILNTALKQIAKLDTMDDLQTYSDKINIKIFDINTINSNGFIEAHYKKLRKTSNGELMPTFNVSEGGCLDLYIKILKEYSETANYTKYVQKPTQTIENNHGKGKSKGDIVEKPKTLNGQIIIEKPKIVDNEPKNSPVLINLDSEILPKVVEQNKIVETTPTIEEKTIIVEKPKTLNGQIIIEKTKIVDNEPKNNPVLINLDSEILPKAVEQNKIVETTPTIEEKTIIVEKPKTLDGQIIIEKPKIVDNEPKNSPVLINLDNSVGCEYDFTNQLTEDLDFVKQKEKIQNLMDENQIVRDFVKTLEDVGINFAKGDETNVNRTATILRNLNGDFEFGDQVVGKTKSNNLKGNDAISFIIVNIAVKNIENKK